METNAKLKKRPGKAFGKVRIESRAGDIEKEQTIYDSRTKLESNKKVIKTYFIGVLIANESGNEEKIESNTGNKKSGNEVEKTEVGEESRMGKIEEEQSLVGSSKKMNFIKEELRTFLGNKLDSYPNGISLFEPLCNTNTIYNKLQHIKSNEIAERNKPITKDKLRKLIIDISVNLNCSSITRFLYNDIIPYRHKKCRYNYFRRSTNFSVDFLLLYPRSKYLWNNFSRKALKVEITSGVERGRIRRDVNNDTALKNDEKDGGRLDYVEKEEKNKNSYNNQIKNAAKARAKELGKQFLYNNTERPRKLDTYAESLLHVNALLNDKYGFKRRKVPAHMPHLIDRTIITELQATFPKEFEQTSARKIRSSNDMQFAFSYFYFLMSEETHLSVDQIFDIFDTDKSGTWSDREIRTILTRLFPIPLQRNSIVWFEQALINCAEKQTTVAEPVTPMYERYLGSVLPLIPKSLVIGCKEISHVLKKKFGHKKRFPHVVMQHQDTVGFYMVGSNLSEIILSLDSIRSKPKKFICLNDNMDPTRGDDNMIVRAALIDFYHSLFPKPSQFELPAQYVNRFLYYDDYVAWKQYHSFVSNCITMALILIGGAAFVVIFKHELRWMLRKLNKTWKREKMISRKRSGALYT